MQDGNRGIGMGYDQFIETFKSVCRDHQQKGRARIFAFVFYDMAHGLIRAALKQANGFQRLHEKTGRDVTLFYLHDSAAFAHCQQFNLTFMSALGVKGQAEVPCMVFFHVDDEDIKDASIYAIDEKSTDPVLIIAELEEYVDSAIRALNAEGDLSGLTFLGKAVTKLNCLVKFSELLLKLKGVA